MSLGNVGSFLTCLEDGSCLGRRRYLTCFGMVGGLVSSIVAPRVSYQGVFIGCSSVGRCAGTVMPLLGAGRVGVLDSRRFRYIRPTLVTCVACLGGISISSAAKNNSSGSRAGRDSTRSLCVGSRRASSSRRSRRKDSMRKGPMVISPSGGCVGGKGLLEVTGPSVVGSLHPCLSMRCGGDRKTVGVLCSYCNREYPGVRLES